MNDKQEDIIRMARVAGITGMLTDVVCEWKNIVQFAKLIAASEREACAKECEAMHEEDRPSDYAYSIRSRSHTEGGRALL